MQESTVRVSKTRSLAQLPQFYFLDFRILTHFKSMFHSYNLYKHRNGTLAKNGLIMTGGTLPR